MGSTQDAGGSAVHGLDKAVLEALFSEFPFGLHILDQDLRLVRFKPSTHFARRFPVGEMTGQSLAAVLRRLHIHDPEAAESTARRVLETGLPARDIEVLVRDPRDSRFDTVVSISWFRLHDENGAVLGLAAVALDITPRTRAESRLRLLGEAGGRFGAALDVLGIGHELATVAVPELADIVAVDVIDSVLRGEAPEPGTAARNSPLRRVGRADADVRERDGAAVGQMSDVSLSPAYQQALADLQPRLVTGLGADQEWAGGEPKVRERLMSAGVHSLMIVPLAARGVVLGLACFYRLQGTTAYEQDDLALAVQLADRAALCLDNVRLRIRETSVARVLQLGLRPSEVPTQSAVETAHSYLPSGSAGDWFDVIPLSGARVALVVGDTSGRSFHAAAAMGELRAAIGALSDLDLPPDELLERLHGLVTRLGGEMRGFTESPEDRPMRASCLIVVYDPVSGQCVMSSAGHPPPGVFYPDGTMEVVDVPEGPLLGRGVARYGAVRRTLPEGSVLVLYNTALRDADPHGTRDERLDSLRDELRAEGRGLQAACDAILGMLTAQLPQHDAVLLLARTRLLGPEHVASWTLRNDPAAAAEARGLVSDRLNSWGLGALEFTTQLVVSELVTNAVRYATGPIELRLIRDRALICEVTDDSSTAPRLRCAEDTDEGGRGLFITAQITQRWGHRPAARGKTIWTEQALL
ncbi:MULTISPECIES: SpoIIE family protein phosphatase [unclassified Streptomyces]|uniref:SpoIIE family protein phosphatase n=1 Tax=unclassified Streptomyces TaxID=2593676 RepID=UPI0035D9907F